MWDKKHIRFAKGLANELNMPFWYVMLAYRQSGYDPKATFASLRKEKRNNRLSGWLLAPEAWLFLGAFLLVTYVYGYRRTPKAGK